MAEKIIIASGKGGSGKTSCCTGVALSLKKKGYSVLVVDCDIAQGCIEFMLGVPGKTIYNWGDVLTGACKPAEAINQADGVDYLSPPARWNDKFTTDAFNKMIATVEGGYSYVLFDSPAGILGGFLLASSCADRGVIITTPDEICVKAAHRAAQELTLNGMNDIRLVVNRFDKAPTRKGMFLNIDEAIDGVGVQLIGVVPEDKAIMYASTRGFSSVGDCPAKAAYERIATRLTGTHAKLDLRNKKTNKSKHPVLRGFLVTLFSLLLALVVAFLGVFIVDFTNAHSQKEPVFEIKSRTVELDENTTQYTGICYKYIVVKDADGEIVSTEMKVGNNTVSATVR